MYRVLLVDDEVHSVRGLQAGVRWERLDIDEVFTAHSLKQAQEVFDTEPVDLMVCDIEMPQGSGLELLEWVREKFPPHGDGVLDVPLRLRLREAGDQAQQLRLSA